MAKDISLDTILEKNKSLLESESRKDKIEIIKSRNLDPKINTNNIQLSNGQTLDISNRFRINKNNSKTLNNTSNLLDSNYKAEIETATPLNRRPDEPMFQKFYEDNGSSSRALSPFETAASGILKYGWEQIQNRLRDKASELELFLYELYPYFIGTKGIPQSLSQAINDPAVEGLIASTLSTVLSSAQKIKYFTPQELVKYFGHNFYSIQLFRGITIKKGKDGVLSVSGPASASDEWNGLPNIFYGTNPLENFGVSDITSAIQNFLGLNTSGKKTENANTEIQKIKDGAPRNALSPQYKITNNQINTELKTNPTALLSNTNVKKIDYMVLSADVATQSDFNGRWLATNDPVLVTRDTVSIKNAKIRNTNVTSGNENYLNKKVTYINLRSNPVDQNSDLINGDTKDLIKDKGFIRKGGKWQVGAIYVIPVVADQFQNSLPSFYIPFEFNPNIEEGGIEAKYQATEIMSRIGALQSYINTGSINVTVSTTYHATSHDENIIDTNGQGWMSQFTLPKIQAIEMAYRSIAYPHFPDSESIDQGYKYVRPPLVKVVIGNVSDKAPYANLLTYQTNAMVGDNRLKSAEKYGGKVLRTFIASSVNITKNLEESPLYLDEDRSIRDTFGFNVSLSLVEVTPSYTDIPPDYANYFNQYDTVWGDFVNRKT